MIFYLFIYDPVAFRILVPWPGIEPVFPAVEAQSPNRWTARAFPGMWYFNVYTLLQRISKGNNA